MWLCDSGAAFRYMEGGGLGATCLHTAELGARHLCECMGVCVVGVCGLLLISRVCMCV